MSDPVRDKFQTLGERILTHVKAPAKNQVIEILNEATLEAMAEANAQAEVMAKFVEAMRGTKVKFALFGAATGAAGGALAAFVVAYRKAATKYSAISDEEIETMREHYESKKAALDARATKSSSTVADIVAERGYASHDVPEPPPMAVAPPKSFVEEESEKQADEGITPGNAFDNGKNVQIVTGDEWDWETEKSQRRPHNPYIVHVDEKDELEEYADSQLTYYEGDDVLCDERDQIVDKDDRNRLIGEYNLTRFGHGSGDENVVYVRNDRLETLYEIVRSPNEYAVEVHGFNSDDLTHEDGRRNLRRMRAREMDED